MVNFLATSEDLTEQNLLIPAFLGSCPSGFATDGFFSRFTNQAFFDATLNYSCLLNFDVGFVAERDVVFRLYTPGNKVLGEEISSGNITPSNFNYLWPVRVIIHGWLSMNDLAVIQEIKNAYLVKGNFNVVSC